MKLKNLISSNNWRSVSGVFIGLYPQEDININEYKNVFEKLLKLDAVETDMSIVIVKEKVGDDEYIDVSGLQNNPKNKEETYSQGIEFLPWCEWLGLDVRKESLNAFSKLEVIVHCLYEMTSISFTEEVIKEKMNKMEKGRTERESMTKKERYATPSSIEDLLKD